MVLRRARFVLIVVISAALAWLGQASSVSAATGVVTHIDLHRQQITIGDSTTISGSVSPNKSGHPIALQRRVSIGHWTLVSRHTLGQYSKYHFSVRPTQTGTITYRTFAVVNKHRVYSVNVHLQVRAKVTQDCTPGYSPCIPPGPDVDCAGGSGDGPRYVYGPVRVTGSDPYGLDSDNDGWGCES
jgi:hypothetical protein